MQTIEHIDQLTVAELNRVRRTLLHRYAPEQTGHPFEVGFGIAEKSGQLDFSRRDAACFLVPRKRMPKRSQQQIPRLVTARLKRGSHFVLVKLWSDVIDVGRGEWHLTSQTIRHVTRPATATTGCLVAWRSQTDASFAWGAITVGHLFWHLRRVPEPGAEVRIFVPRSAQVAHDRELAGRLLARTHRRDGSRLDAALVQLSREQLESVGWIEPSAGTARLAVRAATQLSYDRGRQGLAIGPASQEPFLVTRYHPVFALIEAAGPIEDVIEVHSDTAQTFAPGNSGSLWVIDREACAIQFAGWDQPANPARSYQRGLGIALQPVLEWARTSLAQQHQQARTAIDLRLVAYL